MFGGFPYEAEPDGAVFGPHHFYLGVLLILLVCWVVHGDDDADAGPWAVAGLALLSVFAFSLTWPYYPVVGAFGTLVLLGVATLSGTIRPFWWRYGPLIRGSLAVGLFVALDDVLNHALGWHTPLNALWVEYLYPYVSRPSTLSDVRLPSVPSDVRVPSIPSDPRIPSVPSDVRVPLVPSDVRLPVEVGVPSDATIRELGRLLTDLEALVLEQVADALAMVAL